LVMSMNDCAGKPSEQSPIAHLDDFQVVQFVSDALRAGQRAILVMALGKHSARVPAATLAACASASVRTLHIGPPLPTPPELQEMIGDAAGIAGCREVAPLAMAARLLFAEPRRNVILAIDDAHMLSYRSLAYLTQMTELLAPDAPVLQIVLAAGPDLLDALDRAEFEDFRNQLVRPAFETLQIAPEQENDGACSNPRKHIRGPAAAHLTHVWKVKPMMASPKVRKVARNALCATAGLVAVVCLGAIGSIPLPAFPVSPTPAAAPLLQRSLQSLPTVAPGDSSARNVGNPPQQRETAERQADPQSDSLLSAGRIGDAGNGDREAGFPNAAGRASPSAAPDQDIDAPPSVPGAGLTMPGGPIAPLAERVGAAGDGDRRTVSLTAAAPANSSNGSDQNVDNTPPATAPTDKHDRTGYQGRAAAFRAADSANPAALSTRSSSRTRVRDVPRRGESARHTAMTFDAGEFIRRFLLHVLPSGPHHVHQNGRFADNSRAGNIARAR
jgi:hypothetical protein